MKNENKAQKGSDEGIYTLSWTDLTLQLKKDTNGASKILINQMQGNFKSGDFVSIMGPSGAGKTSLINILTGRISSDNSTYTLSGNLLLNNSPLTVEKMSQISALVQQHDLLFPALTVKQTFRFTTWLKLWRNTPQQQQAKVEEMLKKLNLKQCENSLIGGGLFGKSISGGQIKRVAIGIELISNPQILVLDEPTSGLDSYNALVVMSTLANLAKEENKLIFATIHQPSSLIFRNFDTLYLIHKGQTLFNGPAKNITQYMQRLGINVDQEMNPADFFMLELTNNRKGLPKDYKSPLTAENFKLNFALQPQKKNNENFVFGTPPESMPAKQQFNPLLYRSWTSFTRNPQSMLNKIVGGLFLPVVLGYTFLQDFNDIPAKTSDPLNDPKTKKFFADLTACIFFSFYVQFAGNIFEAAVVYPMEKDLVMREVGSGLYSSVMYFIARLVAELPGAILASILASFIVYYMANLEPTFSYFLIYLGINILMGLNGYFLGMCFGVLASDLIIAVNLMPMLVTPLLLLGGSVVKLSTVDGYLRWIQYVNPLRNSLVITFRNQYTSDRLVDFQDPSWVDALGLDGNWVNALIYLIMTIAIYFIVAIGILYFKGKK